MNYNDFARLWRRFRFVLMLLTALSAVSCRTVRNETRQEATLEAEADSQLAARITNLLHMLVSSSTQTTDTDLLQWTLLTYDTSLPADTLTGRPPLKSELRAQASHHRKTETQLKAERTDTMQEVVVTAGHRRERQTGTTEHRKSRKAVPGRIAALLILMVVVAILGRFLWKKIRK